MTKYGDLFKEATGRPITPDMTFQTIERMAAQASFWRSPLGEKLQTIFQGGLKSDFARNDPAGHWVPLVPRLDTPFKRLKFYCFNH